MSEFLYVIFKLNFLLENVFLLTVLKQFILKVFPLFFQG